MPKLKDPKKILEHAKKFFFVAMLIGYISGNKKFTKKTSDGHVFIKLAKGKFKLVDSYFKNPGSILSSGTTTIYYDGTPIWVMYYGGWYVKEVIPILKMALETAYRSKKFNGGRGIRDYRPYGYTYENIIHNKEFSSFKEFSGHEEIRKQGTNKLLGYHNYLGMSLI